MSSAQMRQKVMFSQEQIQWLEQQFPEDPTLTDPQKIQQKQGERKVLMLIRQQSNVEVRYVVRSIPVAG